MHDEPVIVGIVVIIVVGGLQTNDGTYHTHATANLRVGNQQGEVRKGRTKGGFSKSEGGAWAKNTNISSQMDT